MFDTHRDADGSGGQGEECARVARDAGARDELLDLGDRGRVLPNVVSHGWRDAALAERIQRDTLRDVVCQALVRQGDGVVVTKRGIRIDLRSADDLAGG